MDAADWDRRYSNHDSRSNTPSVIVQNRLAAMKPGRAADLACGDGRHARWLASRSWQVTGVDFSRVVLHHACGITTKARIDWVHDDVTTWTPDNAVDLVLITYLHLPLDELVKLIQRAIDWLTPHGRLLYLGSAYDNRVRGIGGPQDSSVLPDIIDLARAAAGAFVNRLQHELRPSNHGNAIDVLLDITPWRTGLTADNESLQ